MLCGIFFVVSIIPLVKLQNINFQGLFVSNQLILCDVAERLKYGCSHQVPKARSLVHCASLCRLNQTCVGVSQDQNGICFHHDECPMITGCTSETRNHHYLSRSCVHGDWDDSTSSCKCVLGFYGDICKKCYSSCKSLLANGYAKGVYTVYLDPDQDGKNFLQVMCAISPPSYYNIQILNNAGRMGFNKTWMEYVKGFTVDSEHFWIGLETWHQLSEAGWNFVVSMFASEAPPGYVVYRYNYDFRMAGIDTNYKFTFRKSKWLGRNVDRAVKFECLDLSKNRPFSTWDKDEDGDTNHNCASRAGWGWWYSGCDIPCHFFGYGYQYYNIKPAHQLFYIADWDTSFLISEPNARFHMYLMFKS